MSEWSKNPSELGSADVVSRDSNGNNRENIPNKMENVDEHDLVNFRHQWHKELAPKKNKTTTKDGEIRVADKKKTDIYQSDEDKAKVLFMKGAELENAGNMYEAIQNYKKAVQLVPDIEFRLYDSIQGKNRIRENTPTRADDISLTEMNLNDLNVNVTNDDDLDEDLNLLSKIERIVTENNCLCFRAHDSQSTHISVLPMEIILYILRWVVSTDLDLISLEKFGSTCRGFYLCSRDSEIWKLVCTRTWGINCRTFEAHSYGSWRDMFINRPRIKFNGCYISRTTYIRQGESSFQDQFYRPWHLVQYYRYVRFFPDGLVLMLTTADEPPHCVGQLKYRTPKNSNILTGYYRQRDTVVTLVIQKSEMNSSGKTYRGAKLKRDSISTQESCSQVFQLELQIQPYKKKRNSQLTFVDYTVLTKYRNGNQSRTNFELVNAKYPPLWFSRVKSYTAESEGPLV